MEEKEQYIFVNGRFVKVGGAGDGVEFKEVSALPPIGEDGVIYLLPSEEGQGGGGGTSIKVDGETIPELEVGDGLEVVNGVINNKLFKGSITKQQLAQLNSDEFVFAKITDFGGRWDNISGLIWNVNTRGSHQGIYALNIISDNFIYHFTSDDGTNWNEPHITKLAE